MTTTISGSTGITFPAGGTGNTTGTVVGTSDTQTLTAKTLTSPTITGAVVSSMASSVITSGTAVPSTSGSSVAFTGLPSWVKRITVTFQGVSISSTGDILIQLGTGAGPTYTTTGYLGSSSLTSSGVGTANWTTGVGLYFAGVGTAGVIHGSVILTLANSATNTWVAQGIIGMSDAARTVTTGSSIALSGVLTAVQIVPTAANTFDAGSINILYE